MSIIYLQNDIGEEIGYLTSDGNTVAYEGVTETEIDWAAGRYLAANPNALPKKEIQYAAAGPLPSNPADLGLTDAIKILTTVINTPTGKKVYVPGSTPGTYRTADYSPGLSPTMLAVLGIGAIIMLQSRKGK